ncbi:MAG: hypothetical protein Q3962_03675, partial [Corynebacterium sp.]|nr:hypothetical protein [Corynebacterium sp.]
MATITDKGAQQVSNNYGKVVSYAQSLPHNSWSPAVNSAAVFEAAAKTADFDKKSVMTIAKSAVSANKAGLVRAALGSLLPFIIPIAIDAISTAFKWAVDKFGVNNKASEEIAERAEEACDAVVEVENSAISMANQILSELVDAVNGLIRELSRFDLNEPEQLELYKQVLSNIGRLIDQAGQQLLSLYNERDGKVREIWNGLVGDGSLDKCVAPEESHMNMAKEFVGEISSDPAINDKEALGPTGSSGGGGYSGGGGGGSLLWEKIVANASDKKIWI